MGFALVNKLLFLVDILHFVIPSVCCVCVFSTSSFLHLSQMAFTSSTLWSVIHHLLHPLGSFLVSFLVSFLGSYGVPPGSLLSSLVP